MHSPDTTTSNLRVRVLLSVQRALVGEITPDVLAVSVEWCPARILLRVFTDGDASDSLRDDFEAGAVAQIVADFPDANVDDPEVVCEFVRCDSLRVSVHGLLVFARAGLGFATSERTG